MKRLSNRAADASQLESRPTWTSLCGLKAKKRRQQKTPQNTEVPARTSSQQIHVQFGCASIILTRRFCLHSVRAVALLIYIITGKFYKAVWSAQSYLETYKCHIFWIVLYTLVLFGIFAERFYCKFIQCCYPIRLA